MNSKIPDDLLSAYLDRELTAAEELLADSHLKSSPQAGQDLQDYRRLSELLHELPKRSVPAEFASAVMQRAERETLIPLDTAASLDRRPSLQRLSRRAWIVTATGAVAAASIAMLVYGTLPRQQHGAASVATTLEVNDRQVLQTVSRTANVPMATAAPAVVPRRPAPVIGVLGVSPAFKTAAAKPMERKAAASVMYGSTAEGDGSELVLPADLKKAKVGDVIEAMEKVGDQVAVVRLTVINQTVSVGQLQSLLVRESTRPIPSAGETLQATQGQTLGKDRFRNKKQSAPGDHGEMTTNRAGELVCVFIERSREELAGVLQDVQNERRIQAELTSTIPAEELSQYANHLVAPPTGGEHSSSHAQTVLSLPANTVNQILADRRRTPPATADGKGASIPALNYVARSDGQMNQSAAAVRSEGLRVAAIAKGTRPARHALSASSQRPIQVFFVLDDQSVAQSESDAAKPPAAPAAAPAPESQPSKRPHRRPVIARRPATHAPLPAEKAD